MAPHELTVGLGGAAGDGIGKTGDTLAKTCARVGLHIYAYNSYQSLIRGGHVWLRVRISEEKVMSHGDHLNFIIALNQDTVKQHLEEIEPGGGIIFNQDKIKGVEDDVPDGISAFPLPVRELTKQYKYKPIMQNTVALGALLWLTGLDIEVASGVFADIFAHKGREIIDINVGICRGGYDYARAKFQPSDLELDPNGKQLAVLTGNTAFGLGAAAAGCKFYSAYPMTPASSLLHWMVAHGEKLGIVVKQCEDELAVVNYAIGAGHVGVRALCGTSGGGFALMTEAVGMAGMTETPVVIMSAQRGGPSTGLPTKTEQGDLNQLFGASQGDYPRIIIAPSDLVDSYYTMVEAFNLAEKYQCPVLVASDLLLSEHNETVDPDDFDFEVPIERGELLSTWDGDVYKRYEFTETGVSPRVLPGTEGASYVAGSDEHDERGILISDEFTHPPTRRKMMEKRMRKLEHALEDLPPPVLEGSEDADLTLVGWGSTKGVIQEALQNLEEEGISGSHLHIKYLFPFHEDEVRDILEQCNTTVVVENNYSGQFARHLRAETGFTVNAKILKYDGEPFEPRHIVQRAKEILDGKN